MSWAWLLASLHLIALGLGSAGIVDRAIALRGALDDTRIRRVLIADSLWGLAALLWISTGLLRAFAGFEKGSAYYLASTAFHLKMGLLAVILLLEIWPMVTFIRWRIAIGKGGRPDVGRARTLATISAVQAACVALMVFTATAMARGLYSGSPPPDQSTACTMEARSSFAVTVLDSAGGMNLAPTAFVRVSSAANSDSVMDLAATDGVYSGALYEQAGTFEVNVPTPGITLAPDERAGRSDCPFAADRLSPY